MHDYYKLLGVAPSASAAEIRRAYAQLARETHPDRFTDPAQKQRAERDFQDITTAFNALTNPRSRAEYDQSRERPQPRTPEEIARDAYSSALQLLETEQFDEAVTLLRTAAHHGPSEAIYHAALGRVLARRPSTAREAVSVLERAIQLDPRSVGAHVDLASVLAQQGLRLRAQKVCEAAQRIAPRDARLVRLAADLGLGQP